MAEVVDGVDGELEPFERAHLDQPDLPRVDLPPTADEALGEHRLVEPHHRARGVVGQEHAGLLERLTYRGDPVGEAAAVDAQPTRCLGVAPTLAVRLEINVPVVVVHRPPGNT